jgi:hypothetical protein
MEYSLSWNEAIPSYPAIERENASEEWNRPIPFHLILQPNIPLKLTPTSYDIRASPGLMQTDEPNCLNRSRWVNPRIETGLLAGLDSVQRPGAF